MTAAAEPLGDERPGVAVRRLLRSATTAALATLAREPAGAPYASLALIAVDHDVSPILLLSDLAEHSRNIAADDRVSLLLDGTAGLDDPLTGPRASIMGRAARSAEPRLRARFLARHPGAGAYADFSDFHVYRVTLESAHFVAGFGRIHAVEGGDVLCDAPAALANAEPGILAHMNGDHGDAVALYASELLDAGGGGATLVGIDPEGCDVRVGARLLRLDFDRPIADAEGARATLVELARRARQGAAGSDTAG